MFVTQAGIAPTSNSIHVELIRDTLSFRCEAVICGECAKSSRRLLSLAVTANDDDNDDTLDVQLLRRAVGLIHLAKAGSKQPPACTESGDDERHSEQEADVGGRQTGDVAVTDGPARLVPITDDHQQDKGVPDQTSHADDAVDGRHRRVDDPAVVDQHRRVDHRLVSHLRRSLTTTSRSRTNNKSPSRKKFAVLETSASDVAPLRV